MKNRILITGCTGFVGRQVVKSLPVDSTRLRLIVREGKENDAKAIRDDAEVVTTRDLFAENIEWWKLQCTDIDVVIHIAWYVEPGLYLDSPKNFDCLLGSLSLVRGGLLAGVKRIVGLGTCFEYDVTAGVLSIDTPLKPTTPYAATKAALYTALSQLIPNAGAEFAWCRLFYLFGEGEDPRRLVAHLHKKLQNGEQVDLTTGEQIRDFLDVTQAGKQISDVALGTQVGPINICSGIPITVRELALKIANDYQRIDLLRFGERKNNFLDPPSVLGLSNFISL
jgi:dTDP-6-deoxy-L-talose 4-dehydrogenase (NAD+)